MIQTNRHGPYKKECYQASKEFKHYLVTVPIRSKTREKVGKDFENLPMDCQWQKH